MPAERGARGVVAEEPIAADECVMRIPAAVMMSSSSAMRTKDLGLLALQKPLSLAELPTVLLALHLLVEHAKCVEGDERAAKAKTAAAPAGGDVPLLQAPAHDFTAVSAEFRAAAAAAGIDLASILASGADDDEGEHGHGHGGAGGSHGHGHGGKPCHGHGHGGASEKLPEPAPAPAAGAHGHSHGGKPCHGHGHGSAAAPPPAPAPAAGSHGHSHGGKPCHGHGHGAKGHGHGHAAEEDVPLIPVDMDVAAHPWGSAYRPYLALLPERPAGCLFFGAAEVRSMAGLPSLFDIARFVRNTATTYVKLLGSIGPAGNALRGFAPHMTWAGFRWAMSVVMSRQNKLPLPGTDPLANGADFALAAVPLYDMVNSRPGKITSYFYNVPGASSGSGSLVLDAPGAVAAGEEVTMSYGGRSVHQLLQYQGYVPAEALAAVTAAAAAPAPTAAAPAADAAASATAAAGGAGAGAEGAGASAVKPVQEFAFVEASMGGLEADPLFKIRANVLRTLEITPEQAAQRYLQAPQLRSAMMAALKAAGGGVGGPPTPATREAIDRIVWSQPFLFQVYADGEASADLVSFLRVAAIDSKPDAAIALRACDVARQSLVAKITELRQKQAEKLAAAQAKRRAALAARAAGASPAADAEGAAADEDDEDDDDEEEPAFFTLSLTKLSDDNELAATLALVQVLQYSLDKAEAGAAAAAAVSTAGGAGKDSAAAATSPVSAYVDMQVAILRRGLDKARAKLAEIAAAAGIGSEAGADGAAGAPAAPAAAGAMK